ncbi:hypothetical protein BABINDRAFT_21495, partial [Babjeviella inositovora NRRL Y-12698]
RPKNAFILFRQAKQLEVLIGSSSIIPNREVSRELGRRWRNLPFEEKQIWLKLAEEEKKAHNLKYPDYKYQPKK